VAEKIQLENGLEIWKVKPVELREQDLNARTMPKPMFERLSETIKRDNRLESLPFCALTDKGLEIISGHHRVRAAHAANTKEIFVLVDVTGLTPSQIKAKQLAQNAISGTDDPSMLSQIFEGIESIEDMKESFINDETFKDLKKISIDEVKLDIGTHSVLLAFVSSYYDSWQWLAKTITPVDEIAVVDAELKEKFEKALREVGKAYDIKAVTPVVCKMIDNALGDNESKDGWVYLADILGARVPKEVGELLEQACQKMEASGDINKRNRWQILEYLLADYMAGE
jgi:mannose/fructose-specific phosphotransferase system component IIA